MRTVVDQIAEAFIFGEHYSGFVQSEFDNRLVGRSRSPLANRGDIVSGIAKCCDRDGVAVFVREQTHLQGFG